MATTPRKKPTRKKKPAVPIRDEGPTSESEPAPALEAELVREPAEAIALPPAEAIATPAEEPPSGGDALTRYLAEIRSYPRLSREEERDLAVRVRERGDAHAAYRLATSTLRLVVAIAMDYRRSYLNLLDLVQEGNIGLLHAIRKYDPYRGVPFSAYAAYWIRAYLLKHLLDHWSLVRVGTTNARRKLFYNLKREQERLRRLGIEAGPKLLAANLGAEEADVVDVGRALSGRDVSIDAPVRESDSGEGRAIWETMAAATAGPEDQVAREEMQRILKEKIAAFAARLNQKERYILETRLVAEEPLTLQAIGDRFGTTREAVRQVEARLIARLREYLRAEISDLKRFEVKTDERPPPAGAPPRARGRSS